MLDRDLNAVDVRDHASGHPVRMINESTDPLGCALPSFKDQASDIKKHFPALLPYLPDDCRLEGSERRAGR